MSGRDPVERARDYYDRFHWGHSRKARPRKAIVSPAPATLAEIGELEAVVYRTNKEGRPYSYEHTFGEEGGKRPILAADVERDRLHVVGGDYQIEERGIVD